MRQLAQGHMIGLRLVWGWKSKRQDTYLLKRDIRGDGKGWDRGLRRGVGSGIRCTLLLHLSVQLFVHLSIYQAIHPPVCPSCPPPHLSVYPSVCRFIHLCTHQKYWALALSQPLCWMPERSDEWKTDVSLHLCHLATWKAQSCGHGGRGFQWRLWECWGIAAS